MGQIFHCFPPCQGRSFGFTVAQEEHRAAQVLCAPSVSQLKWQQEVRWKVRCMHIICNLNKCHQLGCITYVCPLNVKNSVSTQKLSQNTWAVGDSVPSAIHRKGHSISCSAWFSSFSGLPHYSRAHLPCYQQENSLNARKTNCCSFLPRHCPVLSLDPNTVLAK